MASKDRKTTDIVTLADLVPRRPVVGGSARVFGSDPLNESHGERAMATKKDLPAKKSVKGGKGRLAGNDNLTLVRAATPGKKDLPSKKTVTGGLKRV